MSSLAGQSALITGGGSGIGLACATHLARDGATVVLARRNAEKLSAAAASLAAAGAAVHPMVCDVAHEAQVQAACALAAEVGRFNIRPSLVPTDISVGLTGSPDIVADYLDQMPLARLGTVGDMLAPFAAQGRATVTP